MPVHGRSIIIRQPSRIRSVTPNGATWLENADTDTTVDISGGNVQLRLRIGIVNSGDAVGASAFKLRYSKNAGAYADVTAASTNVKTFNSTHFSDDEDVPQLITSGNYQGDNNAAEDSSGAFTLQAGLAAGARFETEIALEVIAADLANNDTLDFRVTQSDNTALDTYTVTPRITISDAFMLTPTIGSLTLTGIAGRMDFGVIVPTQIDA